MLSRVSKRLNIRDIGFLRCSAGMMAKALLVSISARASYADEIIFEWCLKAKDRRDRAEWVNRSVGERWKHGENANSEIFRGFWLVMVIGSLIMRRKVVDVDYTRAWKANEDIMCGVDNEAVVFEEFVVNNRI